MTNRRTPLLYTRWRACALSFCAAAGLWLAAGCSQRSEVIDSRAQPVSTTAITQGADEMRTGWYGDQPQLAPATVSGFKQIFNTTLVASQMQSAADKVLAQPLVVGNNVLVVTEANNLYLVDGTSGAVVANRTLPGGAFDASAAFGCGDISPTVGITGTPVLDRATNIAYFYAKNAAGDYSLHAINANDLSESPGFPVVISGNAQNDATATFTSRLQLQRPALLLMNGVIYAAFGAHCDAGAYRGWVIGVSTAGTITARFTTEVGTANAGNGNGIWMSGGGLASDGAGRIFFTTGNGAGADPGPLASNAPPSNLVESVVRVDVQGDGSLKAMDFFAPHEAFSMGDADLSGGSAVLLPAQFGSAASPNTAVAVGKEGILYLMDRSKLGGYKQGAGQTDAVLSEIPVNGSLRSHVAVWPGDGGYVYVSVTGGDANNVGYRLRAFKYAPNGQGVPALSLVGVGGVGTGNGDDFGQYSGSPIVTSDGLTSGSAVVWITSNTGALRAYNALPVNGVMNRLIEIGFNDQAKFTKPAVGNGKIYVGTDNGRLVGFGAAASPIAASPLNFGTVTTGQTKTLNAVISAPTGKTITVSALGSSNNALFALGTSTPALPVTLTGAQTLTVPVTFTPTAATAYSGLVNVTTNTGLGTVSLSGTGQTLAPQLTATPASVDFGGVAPNGTTTANVILTNTGSQTLTFTGSTAPAAPFSVTSPAIVNGQTLATGAQTTVSLKYAPTALGTSNASLIVNSNGGNLTIPLTGTCAPPATMVITPMSLDYGSIPANTSKTLNFTIQNTGGLALIIQKSKPPVASQFVAQTTLAEGSTIAAGQTVTETVSLSAATAGTYNDVWTITGSDSSGLQQVAFSGSVTPASTVLSRTGWSASASITGGGDAAGNAIDAAGGGTRYSSGIPQSSASTQTFTLDMVTAQTINQITMDSGGDYARSYQVFASNDANNFGTAIASGTGTGSPLTVTFPQTSARYLRVAQLPTAGQGAWWSIYDFNVYGIAGGGGGGGGGAGGTGGSGGAGGASGGTGGTGGASGGTGGASGGTGDGSALARTGWTGTASATAGGDVTGNALDADVNTRWSSGIAQNAASTQSYTLDMQSAQTFAKLTLSSGNDYARTYQVFAGNSPTTFGTAIASGTGTGALTTITFATQTARYVKITQATNAGATAWWSIYDLNVYQPGGVTALSRSGWIAGGSATGEPPGNAIDGVANSRWSTGAAQAPGEYFTVDMLTAKTFKQLTLDANGSADYPRGYQVFVSADGVNWGTAIASGTPTAPLVTISFAAQTARFIKIVQTATLASNWWSLFEFNVYN